MYSLNRTVRSVLEVGMVVGLAYLVAQTIWLLFFGPVNEPRSKLFLSSEVADIDKAEMPNVYEWEFFGPYLAGVEKGAGPLMKAPVTELALSLHGVFHYKGDNDGWAIIRDNEKDDTRAFRPGEEILDDVTLESVLVDRVFITYEGRPEVLQLISIGMEKKIGDSDLGSLSDNEAMSGSGIDQQSILSQRQLVFEKADIRPVSEDSPKGYVVGEDAKEVHDKYGLQEGDIIVSANGYPLGTEVADVLAYKSFQDIGSASIVIHRGGEVITIEHQE